MSNSNIDDKFLARDIAGYATEGRAWTMLHELAGQLITLHSKHQAHGDISLDTIVLSEGHFQLSESTGMGGSVEDDIWYLGQCVYELLMGTLPFGGQGRQGQTALSSLPSFAENTASRQLSSLVNRCLSYDPSSRPAAQEVADVSAACLKEYQQECQPENLKTLKPQNLKTRMRTYHFWPETMGVVIFMLMMLFPANMFAQNNEEIEKLIRLTTTMRKQSKRAEVLKALKNDTRWTLMDEIPVDFNECTYGDKVEMFGVNDIAKEIAQTDKGILSTGGRFKHSADGVHAYSFIEITVKAGRQVQYNVKDHKGRQEIAIVPFDAKQKYKAVVLCDGKESGACATRDEVSYFTVSPGKHGNYHFRIENQGTKNASFVIITYNPGK